MRCERENPDYPASYREEEMSTHDRDFHLSNGIHFLRQPMDPDAGLGDVGFRIVQVSDGTVPAPVPRLTGDIIMTASDFASVIAAMTPEGDNAETFGAALRFLTTGRLAEWDTDNEGNPTVPPDEWWTRIPELPHG